MRRFFAIAFLGMATLGVSGGEAKAGCSTEAPNCSGTKTFFGKAENTCYRVYFNNKKEELNFCLYRDEPNPVKVQSGDTYCAWERNDLLPKDCKKMWIETDESTSE